MEVGQSGISPELELFLAEGDGERGGVGRGGPGPAESGGHGKAAGGPAENKWLFSGTSPDIASFDTDEQDGIERVLRELGATKTSVDNSLGK